MGKLRQSGRGRAARARAMRTSENGRRIHLPRTLVNKGKKGSTKVEVVSSGS